MARLLTAMFAAAFAFGTASAQDQSAQQNQQRQQPETTGQMQPPGSQPATSDEASIGQLATDDPRRMLMGWDYAALYEDGWSARDLYGGTDVYGPTGDEIGSVENIIFTDDNKVAGVIVEVGGFLDIGDEHLFIPWNQVTPGPGFDRIAVPVTEESAEDYAYGQSYLWQQETRRIQLIGSEDLDTGPSLWKFSDVLGDYMYLEGPRGYGYVRDLIVSRIGEVKAAIVNPDVGYSGGYRAVPWRGYAYARSPYYRPGFDYGTVVALEDFDYDRMKLRQRGTAQDRMNQDTSGQGAGAGTGTAN